MSEIKIKRKLTHSYMRVASSTTLLLICAKAIVPALSGNGFLDVGGIVYFIILSIFGFWLLYKGLTDIFSNKPALIISKEGIVDNISYTRTGLIPWGNVVGAKVEAVNITWFRPKKKHLIIELKSSSIILNKVNKLKRRAMTRAIKKTGSPVAIYIGWIDFDAEKIAPMINKKVEANLNNG